ncbi:pyruvate kinase [Oceanobacillus piezotolerans]|uniref:pyruvate kinase n=1 Tax=Oceanobacillus piezotolerans TaxID=2448030 RepID=UPI001CA46106|nr:pyruvate kinase [Oceanobacillus piezotolerans]
MVQKKELNKLSSLQDKLLQLREEVYQEGNETFERWKPNIKEKGFLVSARNLAYYLALRRRDIRDIQESLMPWGLSSLGRLESRTLENLDAVIASLDRIRGNAESEYQYPPQKTFLKGKSKLEQNANDILGESPKNRDSRIMVTLPTEAAENKKFVKSLLSAGMDVARINCAHDGPEEWEKMIKHIRKAEEEVKRKCKIMMDIAGPKIRIERLYTTLKNPKVYVDDTFFITGKEELDSYYGSEIVISCSTIPEIIDSLKKGDPILIDDGKIEGVIETIKKDGVIVKVKKLKKQNGVRIKVEKGLNFPESDFKINILTKKDKKNLDFVCKHADIIGCSFVKDPEDIKLIQKEINKRLGKEKANKLALMLKIETVKGVQNLPEIMVAAAAKNPLSVMIARGDLAVEVGYLRLAELQEEILWMCEAADVPVVWATQVLENMMKTGIPSRAEITDASQGANAECVMLNKGDYAVEGISILDEILEKMKEHRYKKVARLRALNMAKVEGE